MDGSSPRKSHNETSVEGDFTSSCPCIESSSEEKHNLCSNFQLTTVVTPLLAAHNQHLLKHNNHRVK